MQPHSGVSRRDVLASLGITSVAPVFAQSNVQGDTSPNSTPTRADLPHTEIVLHAVLRVRLATEADATVGSAIILGGEVTGTLAGAVQPGSLEWTRDPQRGVLQLAARFEVQARADLRIHVADRATVETPMTGCWGAPFSTTPELTVVAGSPAECRESVYVGRMDASEIQAGQLRLTVHRVL